MTHQPRLFVPAITPFAPDLSVEWDNTAAVIATFPGIETYSASESLIVRNVEAGGAGCISATSNVNAAGIAALIRALGTGGQDALLARAGEVRARFESVPLIPAIKAAIALRLGDPGYAIVRPPLVPLTAGQEASVRQAADLCFGGEAHV